MDECHQSYCYWLWVERKKIKQIDWKAFFVFIFDYYFCNSPHQFRYFYFAISFIFFKWGKLLHFLCLRRNHMQEQSSIEEKNHFLWLCVDYSQIKSEIKIHCKTKVNNLVLHLKMKRKTRLSFFQYQTFLKNHLILFQDVLINHNFFHRVDQFGVIIIVSNLRHVLQHKLVVMHVVTMEICATNI